MNARYFLDLYLRNAAGVWSNGFVPLSDYGLIINLFHIILSPLTLTFGAVIKTIFDCISRIYTPEADLKPIPEQIHKMNNEDMEQLTIKLKCEGYSPKSNSSILAFSKLSSDSQKDIALQEREEAIKQKKIKYILRENPGMNVRLLDLNNLDKYKFSDFNQDRLDKLKNKPVAVGCEESKNILLNYVQEENNNGKKLFQLIVGFFKEQRPIQANNEPTQAKVCG